MFPGSRLVTPEPCREHRPEHEPLMILGMEYFLPALFTYPSPQPVLSTPDHPKFGRTAAFAAYRVAHQGRVRILVRETAARAKLLAVINRFIALTAELFRRSMKEIFAADLWR